MMRSLLQWKALASILAALVGAGALVAAVLAAVTVWWMLTDPALVAVAVESRDLTPLVMAVVRKALDALFARRS